MADGQRDYGAFTTMGEYCRRMGGSEGAGSGAVTGAAWRTLAGRYPRDQRLQFFPWLIEERAGQSSGGN